MTWPSACRATLHLALDPEVVHEIAIVQEMRGGKFICWWTGCGVAMLADDQPMGSQPMHGVTCAVPVNCLGCLASSTGMAPENL